MRLLADPDLMGLCLLRQRQIAPHGRDSDPSASCKTVAIRKEKCEEVLGRRGWDLVRQYLADHVFVYHCNQNPPYKCSDG